MLEVNSAAETAAIALFGGAALTFLGWCAVRALRRIDTANDYAPQERQKSKVRSRVLQKAHAMHHQQQPEYRPSEKAPEGTAESTREFFKQQHAASAWIVLDLGVNPCPSYVSAVRNGSLEFDIVGAARSKLTLDELCALGVRDFRRLQWHCVTGWSYSGGIRLQGIPLRVLTNAIAPRADWEWLQLCGADGYSASVHREDAFGSPCSCNDVGASASRAAERGTDAHVVLACSVCGACEPFVAIEMPASENDSANQVKSQRSLRSGDDGSTVRVLPLERGLVRAVFPQLFGWKSVKYLSALRFFGPSEAHSARGYWELLGCHARGRLASNERWDPRYAVVWRVLTFLLRLEQGVLPESAIVWLMQRSAALLGAISLGSA